MHSPAFQVVLTHLRAVAGRLGAEGVELLEGLFTRSFPWPMEDARYADNALCPGAFPVELSFSERAPNRLRMDFEPLASDAPSPERVREAKMLFVELASKTFPAQACVLLQQLYSAHFENVRFGPFVGASFDENGLHELKLYQAIGPGFPSPSFVEGALATLPGTVPLLHSFILTGDGLSERFYLRCAQGLRLARLGELAPLAERIPSLTHAIVSLTGGGSFLPPDGAIVGLRQCGNGWELKLELLPASLPIQSAELRARLETTLLESRVVFRRWLRAVEHDSPGEIGVVSVRVDPSTAPSINAYHRPFPFNERGARHGWAIG